MSQLGAAAEGQQNPAAAQLLDQFHREVFWRQFELAKEIAITADAWLDRPASDFVWRSPARSQS
jgi:hypothetical protein